MCGSLASDSLTSPSATVEWLARRYCNRWLRRNPADLIARPNAVGFTNPELEVLLEELVPRHVV